MHTIFARRAAALSLTVVAVLCGAHAHAQPANADAIHDELRSVRDAMLDAWTRRDLDALLTHVDPNVVVTWQNGEVNRGHDEIRRFYAEVLGGEDSIVQNITSTLAMQEMSILHDADTAVAFGTIRDEITFNRAAAGAAFISADTEFALDSRWTAALARKEGRWLLTAYHVSANLFSNPVLTLAMGAARWIAGIVGLLVGIVSTIVVMRLLSKGAAKRSAAT